MELRSPWFCIFILVSFTFSAGIFLYGFFPFTFNAKEQFSSRDSLPQMLKGLHLNYEQYAAKEHKLVLIVVDALRYDFTTNKSYMPHVNNLVYNERGCNYRMEVQAPTVTLPRIKGLVTGSIPSFFEIFSNMGSSKLTTDSLIHQATKANHKIVYYGDYTWTKLFPDSFFRVKDNKDSALLYDYHEGDRNITTQIYSELTKNDWTMMLAHYSGLDHIGHVEGPYSSRIHDKLRETDGIVKKINDELVHKSLNQHEEIIFVLTSDHGMRESGGHGGSSLQEIIIPFSIFGTKCKPSKNTYSQIDITPTLSVLLGLPIPATSIGTLIPELLDNLAYYEQLYALHYNAKHLVEKLISTNSLAIVEKEEYYIEYEKAKMHHHEYLATYRNTTDYHNFKKAQLYYLSSSKAMSDNLSHHLVRYDLKLIILSLILTVQSFIAFLFFLWSQMVSKKLIIKFNSYTCLLTILMGFIMKITYVFLTSDSFQITRSSILTNIILAVYCIVGYANSLVFISFKQSYVWSYRIDISKLPAEIHFTAFIFLYYTLSIASSSFIEEEHQTWYYMGNTIFIILFYSLLRYNNVFGSRVMFFINLSRRTKMKGYAYESNEDTFDNMTNRRKKKHYHFERIFELISNWIVIALSHIFLRRLNQTGDKWLHIPDTGDWFVKEDNINYLSFFFLFSLFIFFCTRMDFQSTLDNILTITALCLIYYCKAISGNVALIGVTESKSKIPFWIFWINIIELLCITFIPIMVYWFKNKSFKLNSTAMALNITLTSMALVLSLLHKPHNTILIPTLILTSNLVNKSSDFMFSGNIRAIAKILLHIVVGKMFYFYQGNSNSLASIDFTAAFIGIDGFNINVATIFVVLHTYSAPLLATLCLLRNLYDPKDGDTKTGLNKSVSKSYIPMIVNTHTLVIGITFSVYLFIITFMRSHLFIWTVFSPKLIYEIFHLIFCLAISLILAISHEIVSFHDAI